MIGRKSATGKQDPMVGPGMSVPVFVNVPFAFEQSYLKSTPFSQMLQLAQSTDLDSTFDKNVEDDVAEQEVYFLDDNEPSPRTKVK